MTNNEPEDFAATPDEDRPLETDGTTEEAYPHGPADEEEPFEPTDPLLQGTWTDDTDD